MAAITDLATAASAGDSDYLVLNQGGTDRKMTRTMLGLTGTGRVATGGYVLTVGGTSAITGSCVGSITGAGTIATGGYTLTVPATGTAALLGTANTFTAAQIINMGANVDGALTVKEDGTAMITVDCGTINKITMAEHANGTFGSHIALGRNTFNIGAAGFIQMLESSGTSRFVWTDSGHLLRIHSSPPDTGGSTADTAGSVVGDQTSSLDSKNVIGGPVGIDDVLAAVQAGAAAVRRFTYKSGSYNGEEFSGVVTDFAPRYGEDRDAEHPAGKSLNLITVVGDLLMAVANLAERVKALEAG